MRVSDSLLFQSSPPSSFQRLSFPPEVDPCLDADVCDQVCVPMNGRITCSCHQDYKMSPTTGECKAKGERQTMG